MNLYAHPKTGAHLITCMITHRRQNVLFDMNVSVLFVHNILYCSKLSPSGL